MLIEEQNVEGCLRISGFNSVHSENPCEIDIVFMQSFREIMYSMHKSCYDRIIYPFKETTVGTFTANGSEIVRKTGNDEFILLFPEHGPDFPGHIVTISDDEDYDDVTLSNKTALFVRNNVTVTFHETEIPVRYVFFSGIEKKY